MLSSDDLHLFNEGTHYRLYDKLGAHTCVRDGVAGTYFAVWAPNAARVSVVGDWNGWNRDANVLTPRDSSGIWEGFIPHAGKGAHYKFHVRSRAGRAVNKADPHGFLHETSPRTASIVWPLDYAWNDDAWLRERGQKQALAAPISIYEAHLGSFMRVPEEHNRPLSYREIAPRLGDHVEKLGFTHVELMPVLEHPFTGSWGYQVTGYFAPTSRHGTPQDFMALVDHLHQRGIGVILDWVPAHFPTDEHGLGDFDGTHLYEHADPRLGFHPDWKSYIFNYGRHEVRSFLISSALFWLDRYHIDGLRVDGVASMLHLDYSRKPGEWLPNEHGGRENLAAVELLRDLNKAVYAQYPDVQTYAEESTTWPGVTRPVHMGGLGFGFKWDLGFMHDTLDYLARDPVYRKHHQRELTFRSLYAFEENFVLPLSHDEVVHGKGSLLSKQPGDDWQRFANLRLLLSYLFAQPGKKLLFMGAELAQRREWDHDGSLDWHLLAYPAHAGVAQLVTDLNRVYRTEPALHERDCDVRGFRYIEADDAERSVLAFARFSSEQGEGHEIVVAFNATPVPRHDYRLGVEKLGRYSELLNSDAHSYGGSGMGNFGGVDADAMPSHGRPYSIAITLPPLAAVFFRSP